MPDRLRLLLAPAVAAALLVLAGCGGEDQVTPTSPTPTGSTAAPSGAAPSSASPAPATTSSSAAPSPTSASPSPTPTASPTPARSASPASTAGGTFANGLSVSEDGALSYVPLRWYAGKDAEARCTEKDIASEGAWCVDYYYEEGGDRLASALTESTEVRLLNDDLKPVEGSLTDLVTAIEDETWPNFQIATSGGKVARITQVFTP